MKPMILAGAILLIALLVTSCTGLAFTVANAPALFGQFDRRADIAFGTRADQRLDVYSPRQGYVAVLPDYRHFPEVKFPAFVQDGADALAWVVSHAAEIGGDPARIYVAGHSAGAHLAAMLAYDRTQLARVGLAPDTVRGFIGLSGPYALDPNNDTYRTIFAAPYRLADWQPVQLAKSGAPPALLLHGEADDVVLASHARKMATALEALGVEVTLRLYPGRGHRDTVEAFALASPHKLPVIEEIRRFVK
jgi:acetyl esterase/lipase